MAQDEQNGNAVTVAIPATGLSPQPPSPPPTAPSPTFIQNGNTSTAAAVATTSVMAAGSQPSLRRGETVEIYDYKKLNRGISRATDNVNLVSQARSELVLDNVESELFVETPVHTFTLPDLSAFPDDFRQFLEKDLFAMSTQTSLEQAQRLNWWSGFSQRLWPLSTSGDGNCLLHAASLGMWGFHDRLLTLRSALHDFLSQSPRREALWRRWRRQQASLNAQAGLVYSEVEWRREWNAIVSMASTVPRLRRLSVASDPNGEISGAIYESLEEIHVLALAHVLRRPIVVIADTVLKDMNGEALAPIPFGGIYLPLECSPSECHRSPLLLAYDGGHFSALVAMDTPPPSLSSAIPLADSNFELLPIQFSIDPGDRGEDCREHMELAHSDCVGLLYEYLDVLRIDPQVYGGTGSSPESESSKPNGLLGSIGKSVGQKLRLKLSRSNSQRQGVAGGGKVGGGGGVLCAALHTDRRHEYHDAMVSNYIQSARTRFNLQQSADAETVTSDAPRYDVGNSQFYTEADSASHERVSNLTPVRAAQNQDTTMYLCKSTFYKASQLCRAHDCTFFGNPQTQNYCSKCYRQLVEEQCKAKPNPFGDENGNEGSIAPLLVDTATTLNADEAGPSLSKRPREPSEEEADTDLIYFIDDPETAFDFVLDEENSGTVIPTAQKRDKAVVNDECSTN